MPYISGVTQPILGLEIRIWNYGLPLQNSFGKFLQIFYYINIFLMQHSNLINKRSCHECNHIYPFLNNSIHINKTSKMCKNDIYIGRRS